MGEEREVREETHTVREESTTMADESGAEKFEETRDESRGSVQDGDESSED